MVWTRCRPTAGGSGPETCPCVAHRTDIPVDEISEAVGRPEVLQRGADLISIDLPADLPWTEREREELAAVACDLALGVVVAAVQDMATVPPPENPPDAWQGVGRQNQATLEAYAHTAARVAALRSWVDGEASFPARDSTLGTAWAESSDMFDRDRRKAWAARCTLRKVYACTLEKLLAYLDGGGSPARAHARWVVCMRFTGLTSESWEDLSLKHHTSERSLRQEMAAVGLPSFHV